MFFVSNSLLWSFHFFFFISYVSLLLMILFYLLPLTFLVGKLNNSFTRTSFFLINSFDLFYLLLVVYLLLVFINLLWVLPTTSVWFGHIVYTPFLNKIFFLILFFFLLILYVFFSITYFSSKEVYDYVIVKFNFFY